MPINAADSITFALEHTKQQLFRPFRIGQWTKLAFVGLLAGELGASGFNRSNFQVPHHPGAPPHIQFPPAAGVDPWVLAALIAAVVVAALAIGIILTFVGSVMRFILFDSVVSRECHIRWSWSRRLGPGWRYFVWKLLYLLLSIIGLLSVVGIPMAFAFVKGWLRDPKEHLPLLVLGGIALVLLVVAFCLITAVVFVLTKDFVVPQMALEGIDVMEGWRRLLSMMNAEKGAYVAYIVLKMVLNLVAAIVMGVATLVLGLIIAVPSIALGAIAVLSGKAAGLTWNADTIALAVVVGCIVLAAFVYLASFIYVPAIVFFPAYSIHFFAGRYSPLRAALYPALPTPNISPGAAAASH